MARRFSSSLLLWPRLVQRLRSRQLELLRRLQALGAEVLVASDSVAGWFHDATVARLITAGITTLGALQEKLATGRRCYAALPTVVGRAKAQRIASHLATHATRMARQQPSPSLTHRRLDRPAASSATPPLVVAAPALAALSSLACGEKAPACCCGSCPAVYPMRGTARPEFKRGHDHPLNVLIQDSA